MKAVMLAAGVGARLRNSSVPNAPKILLRFGGRSLLQRHVEILERQGIDELVLGVGFDRAKIELEISAIGAQDFVTTVANPDYTQGSVVTLWTMREALCSGGPVLLMDADVLYDERLIHRLVSSEHHNCLLLDRDANLDEEAVKLCIRDNEVVEFRKWLSTGFDFCGESVGFFKLSAQFAQALAAQTTLYIDQRRMNDPYEEAFRDVLLTARRDTISFEDVAGLPWIEIDSAADVDRANGCILPRLQEIPKSARTEIATSGASLTATDVG